MAPAPVTKRITTEAKAALKQVFDDLNIPRNKLYCAATLPTEIREVAEEHTLVYSQIARQLSNWKDKKYNFAGKIYSRDPDEIMQVLGDYVPGDNTQFVIDTISKRMIYEKGDDVCFANSYNSYEKNQLQLAALVNGNEHDDVTSFLANFVGHYATLAVEVFPKKAEMLRDAEFDFTQRRLSAVGKRKSDFIQLPSLQSYDKRERALVWMKIEAVLFESWTLHHYDGCKPQIIIDLDDCTVHSYSQATLYYVGGWILHQLFTAVEKTNKKDKATEIFMQQFAMNSTISEVQAETMKLPTSVLNRREQVHLRRPSATFFKFVECLEFIYVENVTVEMMIAYAAGDILQAIADAICASEEERPLSYPIADAKSLAVHSWVTNTWQFTSSIRAHLQADTLRLQPQRQHDTTIMNAATLRYNGITLLRINAVRLYLRLTYLSDMTKSDGKTLSKEFLYLNRHRRRHNLLSWPKQEEPGPTAWSEWRAMFKQCHTHDDFTLRATLGLWLHVPRRTQQWHTLIDHSTKDVFIKNGPLWHLYRTPTRAKTLISFVDVLTSPPPSTALPLSLEKVKNKFRCLPYVRQEVLSNPHPPPITTFSSFLRSRPSHERWVFGHVLPHSPADTTNFLHAIKNGDFYLGSDGSVRGLSTTYASRIQSYQDLSIFLTSHSRAEPTCTLRAEAYGYLGALYLLRAAVDYLQHFGHPIPPATSNQHMDNTGVLTRLSYGPPTSVKYNTARHSDVLREILTVEASLPFTIHRHHVKSHQSDDPNIRLEDLSPPVRINKMCDTSCTLAHSCTRCRPPTAPPVFPSTAAYLLIDNQPFTCKLNVDLLYHRNDAKLRTYLLKTEKWDSDTFDSVHWPAIQTALYRTTSEGRKAATKLSYKLWATNEEMSIRTRKHKDRVDHRCTRCQRLHETYDHVFHCPKSRPILAQATMTLRNFLRQSKIAPVMIQCLLHGITTYLLPRQRPYDFSQHPNDDFLQLVRWAYTQQTVIGWSNLLRGRIASSWLCAHDDYHQQRRLHARHSSTQFGPAFVQALWSFSLTIWHQRNHDVHGATVADFNAIQHIKLNRKITEAYENPDILEVTDHPIVFSKSLNDRLSTSLRAKVKWYSFYESCLNAPDEPTDNPAPLTPELAAFFRPFQQHYRRLAAPPEINPFNPAS